MKASPETQRRLLSLADIDARHARLQHLAKNMPEQRSLAALDKSRSSARTEAAAALGRLEDARAELRRIESDSETVAARRSRDRERLHATSNLKEVQALEQELRTLELRAAKLDDRHLDALEALEGLESANDAAQGSMRAIEEEAEELKHLRDAARGNILDQAKSLAAERAALVAQLPKDLLAAYDTRRERGGIGAAELVGNISGATQMAIDPSALAGILAAPDDEVVLCPDSGAILVRTERSGRGGRRNAGEDRR